MTLSELKADLKAFKLTQSFFIFIHPKNMFLVNQYINAISEVLKVERQLAVSLAEQDSALSLVMPQDTSLKIIYTEEFNEFCEDYSVITNTIVVCEKVDKKLQELVEDYVVEIPKLTEWQIKAYMSTTCPALSSEDIDWLYWATAGDIYRIENELAKILLFPEAEQKVIFTELKLAPESDLFNLQFFDLINAIEDNNLEVVKNYFLHQTACAFEVFAIVNSLLAKAKNMLLAKYCTNLTAEDLEISSKQYSFYKNANHIPSIARLKRFIDVLSTIDLKIKSGELDLTNERQIDYVLTQLVS